MAARNVQSVQDGEILQKFFRLLATTLWTSREDQPWTCGLELPRVNFLLRVCAFPEIADRKQALGKLEHFAITLT